MTEEKTTPKASHLGGQAKKIVKTVNRTGKKIEEKTLVVKEKEKVEVTAEKIKEINEKIKDQKSKIKNKAQNLEIEKKAVKVEEKKEEEKKYKLSIGAGDLLKAGCHLGHKIAKTHPKAKVNIYTAKDGIQVFDLIKTIKKLEEACDFLVKAKKAGKQIVMVGTKRQAREIVRRIAIEAGVAYVTDRWLGGTITNWDMIRKDVKKMAEMKEGLEKNKYVDLTKREQGDIKKEVTRLEKIVGGLAGSDKIFEVVVVVDAGFEKTAVREARLKGIKVVALVDTDSDPAKVDYPIPVNDDNVKSIGIIMEEIGKALKSA